MIISRYIIRSISMGTLTASLALVGLGLFFLFVGELADLGEGQYGLVQIFKYVALSFPGKVVEFMPLAALLGSILSMGALASNSEIVAMQASGVSLARLISPVFQAALILALFNFLLADWVVPDSEASARSLRNLKQQETASLRVREGLWIKDESRVLHIEELLPGGFARDIEIYQLDESGQIVSMIRAEHATPLESGWQLSAVKQSVIGGNQVEASFHEQLVYEGKLSHNLLEVLTIEPRQMSTFNLYAYLRFLEENKLDAGNERLIFWQKLFVPLTIVIMCLLALPFILGTQRQGNTGQRLMIGILLGLAFVVMDRLITQLGTNYGVSPFLVALAPNLIFLGLAVYLLLRKQSHRVGRTLFFGHLQT